MRNADSQGYDQGAATQKLHCQNQADRSSRSSRERRTVKAEVIDQSEGCFRFLVNSAPLMLWMSDAESRCTFVNAPWFEFLCHSVTEELEIGWSKGVHPEDLKNCLSTYREAFQERSRFQMEYRLRLKNHQKYRWILDTGIPQWTREGYFAGYAGMSLDITNLAANKPQNRSKFELKSQKIAEKMQQYRYRLEEMVAGRTAELMWVNTKLPAEINLNQNVEQTQQESEEQFRAMFEQAAVGITNISPEGRYIRTNQRFCEIVGYSREELEQLTFHQITHPDDLAANLTKRQACFSNQIQTFSLEKRYIRKDGSIVWVNLTVSIVRDSQGKPIYDIAVIEDINERKQAEEAVRQAEEKYRSLFENALEGIFQTTPDGHYLNANPALARIYGYASPQELMARLTDIEHQLYIETDRRATFIRLLQQYGVVEDFESQVYRADGSTIWISENAHAVHDRCSGAVLYYEGTVEDITERKQLQARERLMTAIAANIRQSLNLREILNTAVAQVRQFLACDRVMIYRFGVDGSKVAIEKGVQEFGSKRLALPTPTGVQEFRSLGGWKEGVEELAGLHHSHSAISVTPILAVESVGAGWRSVKEMKIVDTGGAAVSFVEACAQGEIKAVEDIYSGGLDPGLVDWLAQFQVRAHLAMPLLRGRQEDSQTDGGWEPESADINQALAPTAAHTRSPQWWGMLVAHQCSGPRQWQPLEMDLLQQLAGQLAIAIQQAELYQQIQEANQELERLAGLDGLTLIANRRKFDTYLDSCWQRAVQEKRSLSLLLCDVDFFKLYNDTYGHQAGDACLQQIASAINCAVERCQRRRRPGKPMESLYLAARYGGEEFAVILPDTDVAGAIRAAKAIRSAVALLKLPHAKSTTSQYVTLSLGATTAVPDSRALSVELIAAADKALYWAKEQGRDRIEHLKIKN